MSSPRVFWVSLACVGGIVCAIGCNQSELQRLQAENAQLRQELASRQTGTQVKLLQIDDFTVGVAASEKSFDENAFLQHLRSSLQDSTLGNAKFAISTEDDEQEIAKVRGMLIQQYLSEKKIPIRVSNLAYKLKDQKSDFKIGGTVVPRDSAANEKGPDGVFRLTSKGPLMAQMEREGPEKFNIAYEDTEGGRGVVPLVLRDVEMFDASQPAQLARQGDISLNWQLSLEKVRVYRISGFEGDVGSFMRRMKFPNNGGLNQYQTIQDTVFLFGYGPYATGLVNRLETPRFIDQVDVLALNADAEGKLIAGISEEELTTVIKSQSERGVTCNFVEFSGDKKIWERPPTVGFPFLSRQISNQKSRVFYTKYDQKGSVLIGAYDLRGKS